MLAAQPLRPIDIFGLFAVMVIGLIAFASYRGVGRAFASLTRATPPRQRDRAREQSIESVARLLVLIFAAGAVILSSLAALGVVVPRPGKYPGGAATTALAIAGLVALAGLALKEALEIRRRRD